MSNIFKFSRRTNQGGTAAFIYGGAMNGGFYAGDLISAAAIGGKTKLIVAPKSTEVSKAWGSQGTIRNISSTWNGLLNSDTLNAFGASAHPAANYCRTLSTGGYLDWYLPAKDELEICYRHLKPTIGNNSTSSGANTNNAVVSERSQYTSTVPSQTSANIFKSGGAENFGTTNYYASNESGGKYGFILNFNTGIGSYGSYKGNSYPIRACRRA